MGKLHELLAVDADVANTATKLMEEAVNTFRKQDHFLGLAQSTDYVDENRQKENTKTNKEIVTTVDDKLSFLLPKVGRSYDVLLQKELANSNAIADLVIDGTVLAKDLPATYLLAMETRLKAMRNVVLAVPTLEPSTKWTEDPSLGEGVFRSEPVNTAKTEKKTDFTVLYDATPQHPAQIKTWDKEVTVAIISRVNFSGMWSVAKKADTLDRIDTLMQGIKQARMRANLVEAPTVKLADTLFNYVLTGALK